MRKDTEDEDTTMFAEFGHFEGEKGAKPITKSILRTLLTRTSCLSKG